MRNLIITTIFFIHSLTLFAHNAQISTVALVQGKDLKWHLIISSSLTAFQIELKNKDGSVNLDSLNVEKFQKLILGHLREKIKIEANGTDKAILENGKVILGHQTDINFEVTGMPPKIQYLNFQQLGFETLRDHYCIFKIISQGNMPGSFMLQKDNTYAVSLKALNGTFIQQNEKSTLSIKTLGIGIICLLFGFLFFKKMSKDKFTSN